MTIEREYAGHIYIETRRTNVVHGHEDMVLFVNIVT